MGQVKLSNKKQFTQEARAVACLYATHLFGYRNDMTIREKKRIAAAACSLVSYDFGYKKVMGKYQLERWLERVGRSAFSDSALILIDNHHMGSTSYTDSITAQHPTHLHELYRSATNLLGDDATFARIVEQMNQQSAVNQDLPTLNLTRLQLYRWFKKNNGKEKRTRRRRDPDALAQSVHDAWNNLPIHTIQRVFDKIPTVLQLIVESLGDSINVEERRGRRRDAIGQ